MPRFDPFDFDAGKASGKNAANNPWITFRAMFDEIARLNDSEPGLEK